MPVARLRARSLFVLLCFPRAFRRPPFCHSLLPSSLLHFQKDTLGYPKLLSPVDLAMDFLYNTSNLLASA